MQTPLNFSFCASALPLTFLKLLLIPDNKMIFQTNSVFPGDMESISHPGILILFRGLQHYVQNMGTRDTWRGGESAAAVGTITGDRLKNSAPF